MGCCAAADNASRGGGNLTEKEKLADFNQTGDDVKKISKSQLSKMNKY